VIATHRRRASPLHAARAGVAALWWEAIARGGTRANAKNVTARLLATARTDVFEPSLDEGDVGQGFVTAPQQVAAE